MAFLLYLRSAFTPAGLLAACELFSGCQTTVPAPPLAGVWRGIIVSGGVVAPARWEIRADGEQSLTLALPQGEITAQGTWTTEGSSLTQWTLSRSSRSTDEELRVVPLASPLKTTFAYHLMGDALTLTPLGSRRPILLTRERRMP